MGKMHQVLHLSQTDLRMDARILKEMHALQSSALDIDLHGLGVVMVDSFPNSVLATDLHLEAIRLWSRGLKQP